MQDRIPCCLDVNSRCGTRFKELRAWVSRTTGRGVKIVKIAGTEQGGSPFYAQPVGYDGRAFFMAQDAGCDTEKLLHEACHFLLASRERRQLLNYGLGPGSFRKIDQAESDNEELTTGLLEKLLAPHFRLDEKKLYKPDYNVANRRNLDWDACQQHAEELYAKLLPSLPPLQDAVELTTK